MSKMSLRKQCRLLSILLLFVCFLVTAQHFAQAAESEFAATEDPDTASVSYEDSDVVDPEPRPPHEPTLVTVTEGQLRGVREEAHNGKEFYSFRGIPFAAPPVGELRFQPPRPAASWEQVKSADTDPPHCPQMKEDSLLFAAKFELSGQEDCLYLNVFSPMHEQTSPDGHLLPVMVFIHGGGYFTGHADQFQPYTLMTQDIVLVVLQYRLGTLGFLSTEDDAAPGNMGILDQIFALDWIQRNAVSFGGNPLMITIFGQSAGGASVHLHMLSHASLGLFHRVIMQSGTTIAPWSMASNHREVAYTIAKTLGCGRFADAETASSCTTKREKDQATYESCLVDQLPSEKIMECLREAPVDVLTESCSWFTKFGLLPITMAPRVDKNLLVHDPLLLLKEGRYKRVDIMMGVTKHDGALGSLMVYSNEPLRLSLHENFDVLAPVVLDIGAEEITPLKIAKRVFDYYAIGTEFDPKSAENVTAMFGDRMNWYPQDTTAFIHAEDARAKRKGKKTYVYEFGYRGEHSVNDVYGYEIGKHWVTHGDELIYLFGAPGKGYYNFRGPMTTERDQKMSDLMVKMWTNFAATGNPTPDDEPTTWQPFSAAQPRVLLVDDETRMSSPELKEETRQFWRQIPLKVNQILFPDSVPDESESSTVVIDEDLAAELLTNEETHAKKSGIETDDRKEKEEQTTKDEL